MSDSQGLSVATSKCELNKGWSSSRDEARKQLQYGNLSSCTATRSNCTNLEASSKKMTLNSPHLYSKPSSIILRIKQHPLSLEVHLPEESSPSSSTTDSSDSDNSRGGGMLSFSTVDKRSVDEDSDAESTYNADGEVACVDDSLTELKNAHVSENRTILIHHMAEVASNIKLGPTGLYLAVQLLDLYWNHHREKGKILDSVQLQVLALTCVHVANNRFNCNKRTPDEFCHLAGVAEGTVKGCMIVKQEASLEALLGGPQVADTISTWGLWRKMGHPANQQHLIQFVRLLKGSDFGSRHFPRDLMEGLHFPSSASAPPVEVCTTNTSKVVNVLLSSAQGCASISNGRKRSLEKPIVFVPMKRGAAQG
ncbi:uncharacterized protein [Physcomitrium patens]|uniref:Cyclin N-terminal domain-containing protein n=1 Tax=Physcomitrium patens TaxID=3218 RepID=A0A2K1IK50_PHYPA|nr:uncharacterized protein LOC112275534 [Physcomitrium patens]XP_024361740.1 uncharacterized protein LOC112275534 [Physcomitrium patens]XP_024361741.1 uncharacterized protein LOC112275534 [Physcomitrium patens]XP_024361742.1 uncharacterized protein LOC112275534 [Physcomitrium patens]PNR29654.1 hypothetical protein PHYPA_028348 [Physcomitrium patens]|eukprot:XP_024361739.1 uncharacterized protein LOC112275534 [Physcomitrella patens]